MAGRREEVDIFWEVKSLSEKIERLQYSINLDDPEISKEFKQITVKSTDLLAKTEKNYSTGYKEQKGPEKDYDYDLNNKLKEKMKKRVKEMIELYDAAYKLV